MAQVTIQRQYHIDRENLFGVSTGGGGSWHVYHEATGSEFFRWNVCVAQAVSYSDPSERTYPALNGAIRGKVYKGHSLDAKTELVSSSGFAVGSTFLGYYRRYTNAIADYLQFLTSIDPTHVRVWFRGLSSYDDIRVTFQDVDGLAVGTPVVIPAVSTPGFYVSAWIPVDALTVNGGIKITKNTSDTAYIHVAGIDYINTDVPVPLSIFESPIEGGKIYGMMKDDGWGLQQATFQPGTADTKRAILSLSSASLTARWDDDAGSDFDYWGGISHLGIDACSSTIQTRAAGGGWNSVTLTPGSSSTNDEVRFNVTAGDVDLEPPGYAGGKRGDYLSTMSWDLHGVTLDQECTTTAAMDVDDLKSLQCPFPDKDIWPNDFPDLVLIDGASLEVAISTVQNVTDAHGARVRGANNTLYVLKATLADDGRGSHTARMVYSGATGHDKMYVQRPTPSFGSVLDYASGTKIESISRIELWDERVHKAKRLLKIG